jgi:hypothetical protein
MKFWILFLFFVSCASQNVVSPLENAKGEKYTVLRLELKNPPSIGKTEQGQELFLGGLSGLRYMGKTPEGKLRFLSHTDRGPNASEFEEDGQVKRPFALPNFQPRIVFLLADLDRKSLEVEKQIFLRRPDRKNLSGLSQKDGQEIPVELQQDVLPYDPYGLDLEGIVVAADGAFWLVDEYGPSVVKFSKEGKMLEALKPGLGLPKILEQRRLNRGFEGAALTGNRLFAILQSPLDNPLSSGFKNSKNSSVIRIIEVDLIKKRTLGQYVYLLEEGKSDKIGDIASDGARSLFVVEHDGKSGKGAFKKVYRADFSGASNLQLQSDRLTGAGGTLEGMNRNKIAESGIQVAKKEEILDLAKLGVLEEKVEGIDLVEDEWMALLIDNDFSLSGERDRATGLVELKNEPSAIYLIPRSAWK